MGRTGTAHKYTLVEAITHKTPMDEKTPAERGIMYYLRLRELEGEAGATQAEMCDNTGLSDRTIGTAVRSLKAAGIIE